MCFRPATTAKLKICPNCGATNLPTRTTCLKCNAELESEDVYELIELPSDARTVQTKATRKSQPEQLSKKQKELDYPVDTDHGDQKIKAGFETSYYFNSIMGESSVMEQAKKLAQRFSASTANIILVGESGTGKELFAQAIHHHSRRSGPFIVLNCAAIPKNLIESELFGYDGGAFTGANKNGSQGKIELAERGTLFLDEIGEMPLETQAVLLRVLENKQVMRIGGQKYRPIDFRLVAATNKDLRQMVDDGLFRLDLYYRLSVLKVNIPPLRQRAWDIILLATFFLKKHCSDSSLIPMIGKDTRLTLLKYHWPGNVRQLENAMIYALHVCDNGIILPGDLPDEISGSRTKEEANANRVICKNELQQADDPVPETIEPIKQLEKNAIEYALFKTGNNIALASDLLGVSKSTLYRKVKLLGINK